MIQSTAACEIFCCPFLSMRDTLYTNENTQIFISNFNFNESSFRKVLLTLAYPASSSLGNARSATEESRITVHRCIQLCRNFLKHRRIFHSIFTVLVQKWPHRRISTSLTPPPFLPSRLHPSRLHSDPSVHSQDSRGHVYTPPSLAPRFRTSQGTRVFQSAVTSFPKHNGTAYSQRDTGCPHARSTIHADDTYSTVHWTNNRIDARDSIETSLPRPTIRKSIGLPMFARKDTIRSNSNARSRAPFQRP